MKTFRYLLATGLAAVLAACGSKADQAAGAQDSAAMAMDSADAMDSRTAMPGMGGQMGDMMSTTSMDEMQQHMQVMVGASADSMQAMLPMHRQMTANMLSMMNREMREMNMTADANWSATMDSIRQDLVRMPEIGPQELRELMPAHRDRVLRLMEMHRSMMGNMNM